MRNTKREDQAAETLFDEYAKVEEVDRRDNRWIFPAKSLALPADIEDGSEEEKAEPEYVWNRLAEPWPILLTEEISSLEVENDAFQATTKLRHENEAENRA